MKAFFAFIVGLILAFWILLSSPQAKLLNVDTFTADGPSYFLFNFSNLEETFGNHRSFGYPLVIRAYRYLYDFNLEGFHYFQFFVFVSGILLLGFSLKNIGLDLFQCFVFAYLIFSDNRFLYYFNYLWTEPLGIGLVSGGLGLAIWNLFKPNLAIGLFSALFLTAGILCRSALIFVIFLPIVFCLLAILFKSVNFKKRCLVPALLSFGFIGCLVILRYLSIGELGLASIKEGCLAGHTAFYLNHEHLDKLSAEYNDFAKHLLAGMEQMEQPCKKNSPEWKSMLEEDFFALQDHCYPYYLSYAWSSAIRRLKGVPFSSDPKMDLNSMLLSKKSLSFFHSDFYDYKIEAFLKGFNKEMLELNQERHLAWVKSATKEALIKTFNNLKRVIDSNLNNLKLINLENMVKILLLCFCFFFINRSKFKVSLNLAPKTIVVFCSVLFYVVCFLPVLSINTIHLRFLDICSIFILPSLVIFFLPTFKRIK